MARNLFDGLESVLTSAREGKIGTFEVHKAVQPRVRKYAYGLARAFRWVPICEVDDLEQEGLLIFWRDLGRYVYLCPVCGVARGCEDHFSAHMEVEHGQAWLPPKTTITGYLSSRVKAYMRAYLRNRRAACRDACQTVNMGEIDPGWFQDEAMEWRTPEIGALTHERFSILRELLETEVDARIRVAVAAWRRGALAAELGRLPLLPRESPRAR